MKRNKSAISKASSYKAVGEYWDSHDLSKVWGKTKKVQFNVKIETEATYYAIEKSLSEKVQSIASKSFRNKPYNEPLPSLFLPDP
jgi:hypothetical protein